MKRYQRILICIDQPERDYRMLGYAGAICRVAETKEVHLLHVEQVVAELPAGPAMGEQAGRAKTTPQTLRDLTGEHLKGHGQEKVAGLVVAGSPLVENPIIVEDGCIVVPQGDGLGMELDWEELERRTVEVL